MANKEHLAILLKAIEKNDISIWNQWRTDNPNVSPYLSWADLRGAYLSGANLERADLSCANLRGAYLTGVSLTEANLMATDLSEAHLHLASLDSANLSGADFINADLTGADLTYADLRETNLSYADLRWAYLSYSNLSDANLSNADLKRATLFEANLHRTDMSGANLCEVGLYGASLICTNLTGATFKDCSIYGISVWDSQLTGTRQQDLNISPYGEVPITVDSLKIAHLINLLLNNPEIRDVIDTISHKAVLILGRVVPECKAMIDAIREELRKRGFFPILLDYEKPSSRDLTETVVTLAHLSCFVIADLTDPSSITDELMSFTRDLPSVPVQPILLKGQRRYAMFLDHLGRYQHVLECYEYESQESLIAELGEKVIQPVQDKAEAMKPNP